MTCPFGEQWPNIYAGIVFNLKFYVMPINSILVLLKGYGGSSFASTMLPFYATYTYAYSHGFVFSY